MNAEEVLQSLGLTSNEVKVYLALLKLGEATATPLKKATSLHASRIYEALYSLSSQGFVTFTQWGSKKKYRPLGPERLVGIARQVEKNVAQIVPYLKAIQKTEGPKQIAEVYGGMHGIKSVLDLALEVLKTGDTYYVLGAPKIANEKLEGFLLDTHRRRVKKRIKLKIIYHRDAQEFGALRKQMHYTQVKYISSEQIPSWIEIFKDYVATYQLTDQPVVFVIKSKEVAASYKNFFNIVWEKATDSP